MVKFEKSEALTGGNEGGYANNPADNGGETYAGIARNFWANWEGWKHIDKYKADYKKAKEAGKTKLSLAGYVNASAEVKTEPVHGLVSKFYKTNFWDVNSLDKINDQQLADTVYDFGVNSGTGRAAKYLQKAINNVAPSVNILEDGKIGNVTINHANTIAPDVLHTEYNRLRRTFYNSIALGNQAQFLPSWLRRLKPYKYES